MEEMCICPFDPLHRVVSHRMPYHIVKCRKNYNGPPLDTCPFNVTHMVPKGTLREHFVTCQSYYHANREKIETNYKK